MWTAYLLFPIWSLVFGGLAAWRIALSGGILAVFLLAYAWYWRRPIDRSIRDRLGFAALMVALAVALAVATRNPYEVTLVVYAAPVLAVFPALGRMRLFWVSASVPALVAVAVGVESGLGAPIFLTALIPYVSTLLMVLAAVRSSQVQRRLRRAEEEVESLAAANERLRISRDLHDVLGHALAAIAFRADVASVKAGDENPEAAAEMRRVADLAREALDDVRAVITGYRRLTAEEEWLRAKALLSDAGFDVEAGGPPEPLPPHLDRALALIIRETSTNILKHSRGRSCRLALERRDGRLTYRAEDRGAGAEDPAAMGNGLTGIAERVEALGGRWSVEARDAFAVEVELPLEPEPAGGV